MTPAGSSMADRKMVELVRFLARRAAERDFNQHLKASRGGMDSDSGGGGFQ